MALLADYTAGTVTSAGNVITGSGTGWLSAQFREGDIFTAAGWSVAIASVDSNTQITVDPNRGVVGADLTDAEYGLSYKSDGSRTSAQARQLIDMLGGSGNLEAFGDLDGLPNMVPVFTGPGAFELRAFAAGLVPMGDYDPDAIYMAGWLVTHLDNAFASIIDNNTGNTPPATAVSDENWQYLPTEKGADGSNAFLYIAYASDAAGTDFTLTFDPLLDFVAFLSSDTEIPAPAASDFDGLWKQYKGAPGSDFKPDEVVTLIAGRAAFDDEPKGFSVLVEADAGHEDAGWLYFKLSGASADWSAGTAFGGGGSGTVQSVNGIAPVGGNVAIEAEHIPTSVAGTFEGADIETVLDDHEGRIVDLEAEVAGFSMNPTPLVGVNATADLTNRLSVKSPASLFDEEGGDHRMKINKALATDTASILFQTAYSGRAEFGLTGNDNWGVKVSPDGEAWTSAFAVDAATGRVTLPPALPLSDPDQIVAYRHVREKLTANRTYYVLSDGNDSNNGLAETSGGAFLTPQKAFDTICTLDLNGYNATISIGAGTFGGLAFDKPWVGGNIDVTGAGAGSTELTTAGPSGVVRNTAALSGVVTLRSFKISATGTAVAGIRMDAAGKIIVGGGMEFGSVTGRHMLLAAAGAFLHANSNYTISGGAAAHMDAQFLSYLRNDAKTITITGTPAFGTAFCAASNGGTMLAQTLIFSGSATGKRYEITTGGGVNVAGGGANYFPGNVAGVATAPGWYA